MMNEEESAAIIDLIGDLETDLRNGNVPTARLLIVSLVNHLQVQKPLEWKMLADFLIDHLDSRDFRFALLTVLLKCQEIISPSQPEQEADPEC